MIDIIWAHILHGVAVVVACYCPCSPFSLHEQLLTAVVGVLVVVRSSYSLKLDVL